MRRGYRGRILGTLCQRKVPVRFTAAHQFGVDFLRQLELPLRHYNRWSALADLHCAAFSEDPNHRGGWRITNNPNLPRDWSISYRRP
ncbi:hypothetical protein Salmuc_00087 [Salipiger mucosus DSM 16094]|uniref:Uncharacterized protein n=1 Tax=Salipiger mucosus DSM 16094 TaxID=1123237 RepID=S9RNS0_9RHOB|nr:hypothetical protein Salmuc_00087 [Salipiger mucosus DSM 16094]